MKKDRTMTANFDMIQKAYEGYRAKLETVRKILKPSDVLCREGFIQSLVAENR